MSKNVYGGGIVLAFCGSPENGSHFVFTFDGLFILSGSFASVSKKSSFLQLCHHLIAPCYGRLMSLPLMDEHLNWGNAHFFILVAIKIIAKSETMNLWYNLLAFHSFLKVLFGHRCGI